ncbi:ubiquinol oxidase 2, mitochondrial-like protein [Tanacetum coccineum]|uniref:Ubiquinol oxidase n=1 Tax=Tanacetum coccineum TaxID=301880 RepID=A0ABQ5DYJ3_9ASTR
MRTTRVLIRAMLAMRSTQSIVASSDSIQDQSKNTEDEKKITVSSYWGVTPPSNHKGDVEIGISLIEPSLVFAVQGVFFNAYFLAYLASPKLAHRITGYLEEEAVSSYTEFLNDLENGAMEDIPAPAIAIDYWCLPQNSTLKDVVRVIRADEAHHRDINHFASDIHCQGHELKEYPAPIGYH